MANIFQQAATALGLTGKQPLASATSAPEGGSTNVAFHLNIDHQVLASGETVQIAAPQGATVVAGGSMHAIIVGGAGNDHLTGGDGPDLMFGGGGINVLTGGGGVDVFGHSAGATDFITDFRPGDGEKIAVQDGISFASSSVGTIAPTSIGLAAGAPLPTVTLTFSDASTVTLVASTDHPGADWFL